MYYMKKSLENKEDPPNLWHVDVVRMMEIIVSFI